MPEIFINGEAIQARDDQTVMEVAREHGHFIPYFCWHPQLSTAGNCRMCLVEVEGRGLDIACNMPVSRGMKVFTNSEEVQAHRKAILQFITLNHPVDCGICDKAGECSLQDYHYELNGQPSISTVPKVHATKYFELSSRIVLDNERCIVCSRCVRFTREVSKSHALGIQNRGDGSLVRPVENRDFESDAYSDNVIDICPVGALLSKQFLHKARVWYLKATPSVCPGCGRGCTIDLWHRKPEWKLNALDQRENTAIARVTPRENPDVNGPWICNKARDLAQIFERPRAQQALQKGRPLALAEAISAARRLIGQARRPAALISSWGSNEELKAFKAAFGDRMAYSVKADWQPVSGEPIEDDLLIRADKNPNTRAATALFGESQLPADADLILVWGEGANFATLPRGAKTVLLGSYLAPENGHADVFIPVSIQTERAGHYTNFAGVVSRFEPIVRKKDSVAHAEQLFAQLTVAAEAIA